MNIETVWVVAYGDGEATVTLFDNEKAVISCFEYFNSIYNNCSIDECYIS